MFTLHFIYYLTALGEKYNDLPKEIYPIWYKSSQFPSSFMDMYFMSIRFYLLNYL